VINAGGNYTTTLKNIAGCDSVVTLHLAVNPAVSGDTTATNCSAQLPFNWHGQVINARADYTTALKNIAGSDREVTMHLDLNPAVGGDSTAAFGASFAVAKRP
jgi:hypothetical protein